MPADLLESPEGHRRRNRLLSPAVTDSSRPEPAKAAVSATPERRRGKGRPFPPGQSGNPGGRKRVPPGLTEAFQASSWDAYQKLVDIMQSAKDPRVQAMCAIAILDRGLGRPTQPISGDDGGPVVVEVVTYGGMK